MRRHWPDTHLRLVTNGFFLHRHPELPAILQRDRNACIYLSLHHDSPEFREKLRPHLQLLGDWVRSHGIRVKLYRSFENWTRRYHGFGSAMEPFNDLQPRQSWEHCPARYCPQLFEGNLWKCGPLAYLKLQAAKYRLSESWSPYLRYQPLTPDCTDDQLAAWEEAANHPT